MQISHQATEGRLQEAVASMIAEKKKIGTRHQPS
jgi:hypothetical protein